MNQNKNIQPGKEEEKPHKMYPHTTEFFLEEEREKARDEAALRGGAEERVDDKVNLIRTARESITDGLTGIYNRRAFEQIIENKIQNAKRHKEELSMIMLDMDKFKNINDNLGHLVGDTTLRTLTKIIKRTIRKGDIVARYGGEEFAIFLPNTNLNDASAFADRLRDTVEKELISELKKAIETGDHTAEELQTFNEVIQEDSEKEAKGEQNKILIRGTISMGVSAVNNTEGAPEETASGLINRADKALFSAKEQGRNQIFYTDNGDTIPFNKEALRERVIKEIEKIENELYKAKISLNKKRLNLKITKEKEKDSKLNELEKKQIAELIEDIENEESAFNAKIAELEEKNSLKKAEVLELAA